MGYSISDLEEAYRKIGVVEGGLVLLKTDLRFLGNYQQTAGAPEDILEAHYVVLERLINFSKGTLVVSTSSIYLCNTNIPFDIKNSKSERGVLTEYIRTKTNSVRSRHPFLSYTAIGKNAADICGNASRHGYGPCTPEARLVERDALVVSVGLPPRLTCSTVHHVEFVSGVPYRYTKEFIHPTKKEDGAIASEPYYLFVYYRDMPLRRNRNVKVFNHFSERGHTIREEAVGRGKIYSYSARDFFESTVDLLQKDIYAWMDSPPEVRPYQK